MPHISIKMLEGRTDEQKKIAAQKVADTLVEAVGCSYDHITMQFIQRMPIILKINHRKRRCRQICGQILCLMIRQL